MRGALLGPKVFITQTLRDYRNKHRDSPFMPVGLLAEQLKVSEEALYPLLQQLQEHGLIEFHPMWPTIREVFVSDFL